MDKRAYNIALFVFFVAFVCLEPNSICIIAPYLDKLYYILQIVSFILIMLWFAISRTRLNQVSLFILLYYAVICLITLYIHQELQNFRDLIRIVTLTMLVDIGYGKNSKKLLYGLLFVFNIISFMNLMSFFMFPNGMYFLDGNRDYWLLGYKNFPIRFLLPGLCISFLYSLKTENKILSLGSAIYLIMFSLNVIFIKSGTANVGFSTFLLLNLLFSTNRYPKWINVTSMACITFVLFLLIYFMKIQNLFEYLIVDVLGKSMDFSGRTDVWERAFDTIKNNLLTGVGWLSDYNDFLRPHTHAHQYWLQIVLSGGLLSLIPHSCIFISASKQLNRTRNNQESKVMLATVISFLIMGIDESLFGAYMLLPLLVLAYEIGSEKCVTKEKEILKNEAI